MALKLEVEPSPNWEKEKKMLLEPYDYITQRTGKQIRSKLMELMKIGRTKARLFMSISLLQAFNHWLKVSDSTQSRVGTIIEMLHNSSLLIDDIEDNSILRRGIPVAHNVYGMAITINCANYVYFLSLHKITSEFPKDKVTEAVSVYTKQMCELHRGQGLEIYWREHHKCPTEEEYTEMISLKTGGLFGLGVQLLQLFSDYDKDLSRIIFLLGVIFQIRDDYLNLQSNEYKENKSFCEDLTEGKFSFPIVHGILSNPDSTTLINILRQRTHDEAIKKLAVQIMEEAGSFKYCRNVLKKYDQEAREEIAKLGGNPLLLKLLDAMQVPE